MCGLEELNQKCSLKYLINLFFNLNTDFDARFWFKPCGCKVSKWKIQKSSLASWSFGSQWPIIWTLISSCFPLWLHRKKCSIKGALSGLKHFLASESPLKMMKNAFYFTSKALFVLKIFKFLPWFLGHVAKRLDKENKVNFKLYDVTSWFTNNCNTNIARYLEK